MFKLLRRNLRRLCSHLRCPLRRRHSKPEIIIKEFQKPPTKSDQIVNGSSIIHPNSQLGNSKSEKSVRIATFNAALFSMAPAVPKQLKSSSTFEYDGEDDDSDIIISRREKFAGILRAKSVNDVPKSILKQSPETSSRLEKFAKTKLRVSINLPDNEISLLRNKKGRLLSSELSFPEKIGNGFSGGEVGRSRRSVMEILKELDADILALQDVMAAEENSMKPLSELADGLGMSYVFAECWAPEYGNAVLSKWPIKRWNVQKIADDSDFRNILKTTIDIPEIGEINLHCTHLDHLDEKWRMKQINSIIQNDDHHPYILAGSLNSLDHTDYSIERWNDIVKYYEEMGKPTPKDEVMKYLKSKEFIDAKEFSGECESVVMIAKGQSVQGTCKYGTRVDYILGTPNLPFKFVPGSYSVLSSKGTSDHHIVKVDITKVS